MDEETAALTAARQRGAAQPGFDIGSPNWAWLREAFRSSAEFFTAARLTRVTIPVLIVALGLALAVFLMLRQANSWDGPRRAFCDE